MLKRGPGLVAAVLSFLAGCRSDSAAATGHAQETSSSTSSQLDTSTSTTAEATTLPDSSTSLGLPDLGSGDDCAPAQPGVEASSAGVIAFDWPTGPTLDAVCDAVAIDDPIALLLSCAHPETGEPTDVRLSLSEGAVNGQLDGLPGTGGLRLSFYNRPPDAISCFVCNDLSLRDAEGGLILRAHVLRLLDAVPAEGSSFDVSGPGWLEATDDHYAGFSAPFTAITVDNIGCSPRTNLRPGSDIETPLAVRFAYDGGQSELYDRNFLGSVEVGDERFDLRVSDAFFRGPLNCGDCPPTEVSFLILRALAD